LNGIKIERTKLKAAALGDTQNKRGSESSEGFPRIGGLISLCVNGTKPYIYVYACVFSSVSVPRFYE